MPDYPALEGLPNAALEATERLLKADNPDGATKAVELFARLANIAALRAEVEALRPLKTQVETLSLQLRETRNATDTERAVVRVRNQKWLEETLATAAGVLLQRELTEADIIRARELLTQSVAILRGP